MGFESTGEYRPIFELRLAYLRTPSNSRLPILNDRTVSNDRF